MDKLRTEAKKLSPNEQYQLRKTMVRLLTQGYTPSQIAKILDIGVSTVYKIQKLYNEKGIE
ncbi:MAG: helix-turn-helix domain-containing protein, partial [Defluviitaleaceae bacterium]|nr:helix-turn-helix domain-containing protein [Defluviitaleaceae bacterium]